MAYKEQMAQMAAYRREISAIRARMQALSTRVEPEPINDYQLLDNEGPVRLSELFGRHRNMFVIHSMGVSCPYCTAWADGYNGVYQHLTSRAAFCIVGPDDPQVQREFARARGWRFRLLSHQGSSFAEDLGYRSSAGQLLPGLSVLRRDDTQIVRVSDAAARPGDDFNALCRLVELLPGGWDEFPLALSYDSADQ